jgi:hypothetical protein
MYADSNYVAPKVSVGEFQSVMPWDTYSRMTEVDLGAIYEYLQTLPPADNSVVKFTSINE